MLTGLHALAMVTRAGMIGLDRPSRLVGIARAMRDYGSVGGAIRVAAIRHGDRRALVDDLGTLSFVELDDRSSALTNAWSDRGIVAGTTVGLLCRNHRGLLDALFAAAKLGARVLLLNTDFAGPQLREVCEREGVEVLVYDAEFAPLVTGVSAAQGHFLAWADPIERHSQQPPTLEQLIESGDPAPPPAPARAGSLVVLTSGTTGTPKGAQRPQPRGFAIPGAVLSKVPYRAREATYVAPPIFHGLGLLNTTLNLALGSTVVTARHFDPQQALASMSEHRCTGLVAVPVMLQRMLDLGDEETGRHDLSALRIILAGGAQLGSPLTERILDTFGDVLYNFYGSTEAAYATIATPKDLRAAPGSVGRPPFGTTVKILDGEGNPVSQGATGTIYVGNPSQSSGYTGGGSKPMHAGLMSTGDVGHFDDAGRLFVDGRDDDMIVSGGENVFPGEVTELLIGHEAIADAVAIGVPDEQFGQALRAFVVRRSGHRLTEADVQSHVKTHLARYKVPRSVVFLDALPRNPSGKVLTRELTSRTDSVSGPRATQTRPEAAVIAPEDHCGPGCAPRARPTGR